MTISTSINCFNYRLAFTFDNMEGNSNNAKVNESQMDNSEVQSTEAIEKGLSKLQNTLNILQQTEKDEKDGFNIANENAMNNDHDEECDNKDEKDKNKSCKNRELDTLNDNQILPARLRSGSGRVYSSGVIIDSALNTDLPRKMQAVSEEDIEINSITSEANSDEMWCSNRECCKNSSRIVSMIENLQKSVDDIKKSARSQTMINAGHAGDMRRIEDKTQENAKDIQDLEKELDEYKFQLKLVRNVVIRQDQQIAVLNKKINDAQQREMFPNLVISGITEAPKENTLRVFNQFIQKELEIPELIPAHRAYRIGQGKARPMIVELRDPLTYKARIYQNVGKLKYKRNSDGGRYFVADRLPEEYNEDRRRINDLISENKKKPDTEKLTMSAKKGRLLIDDKVYKKAVHPPSSADILKPTDEILKLADEIDLVKGGEESLNFSHFVAYAGAVQDVADVQAAYTKVRRKFSDSSHVVCAYRMPGKNSPNLQDYVDDGEFGAGRVMLNLLKEEKLMNVVIFMIRQFGGQHLGPQRFDLIRKVSQTAIENLREKIAIYEKEKEEKRLADLKAMNQIQQTGSDWSEWNTATPSESWEQTVQKTVKND